MTEENKIKIYKFRTLGTDLDLKRLKIIIETGNFWCSNFWDLNDPMEGIYRNSNITPEEIKDIFEGKNKYKICSFTGKEGLHNPLLWGYYANGFKGVVIEVEVEITDNIKPMKYVSKEDFIRNTRDVQEILNRKLKEWGHEDEIRFLIESGNNLHKIGKITKIYFGNPYGNLNNTSQVLKKSKNLRKYNELKVKLKEICEDKNLNVLDIDILR